LFLLQTLHRNTACIHLPRLTGRDFTASAYCRARSRLPSRCSRRCSAGSSGPASP
jgi:hypothetical protein